MESNARQLPHIIALVGLPGAGKITFASAFADAFPAPFINGQSLHAFTNNSDAAHELTLSLLKEMMKTKKTIVLSGPTDRRIDRKDLAQFARDHGYRILFVWVQTDQKISKNRALKQMSAEEYERRVKQFSPPHESEPYIAISGHRTVSAQMRTLLRHLTDEQQSSPRPAKAPVKLNTTDPRPGRIRIS